MMRVLKGFVYFLACLSACVMVSARASSGPEQMLQATSDQLLSALQQKQAQIKQEPSIVYDLAERFLLPHVDIESMAKLALGRAHWLEATPAQRQQFMQAFQGLMIRTYGTALAAYTDETITFHPIRGGVGKHRRVQVDSTISQHGGPDIPVNYRLVLRGNTWKVYDITVDGISMVQSFRSQFSHEIAHGGIEGLLAAMDEHHRRVASLG